MIHVKPPLGADFSGRYQREAERGELQGERKESNHYIKKLTQLNQSEAEKVAGFSTSLQKLWGSLLAGLMRVWSLLLPVKVCGKPSGLSQA